MSLLRRLYCAFVGHQWIHGREHMPDSCVVVITCYRCFTHDRVTVYYTKPFEGIKHLINTGYVHD